ncbi:hypothetical protein [Tunturiibacter gelidoferens]|uniref:Uncharacterized protein n=1 Tax=Tunturiibacter gelidiferens TaxID=3069689 RepID=A0A9X0U3U0_9BACT|nr:hypothetical protein [Edaphobacter lichenicola]MBB5328643.1 hypothetical protein [Edaphobacter lichenicola]
MQKASSNHHGATNGPEHQKHLAQPGIWDSAPTRSEIHHDRRAEYEYFVDLANGQRLRMSKTGWRNLTSAHIQQS